MVIQMHLFFHLLVPKDISLFPQLIIIFTKFFVIQESASRPHPYSRGKCIHCFRHVFAVKSFAQSEKSGRLLNNSVPYLSVYLGHYDMNGTEKYLKFSSDMLPDIAQNFESYTKDIFPEVPYEIQNK